MVRSQKAHRILIVGSGQYEIFAAAWHRALTELGHQSRFFNYDSLWLPGFWGRLEQRLLLGPSIYRINRKLREAAHDFQPEIILLYAAHPVWPSTVGLLSEKSWTTTYHNDDPFGAYGARSYFRFFKGSLPFASSHHVFREANVHDYAQRGYVPVEALLYFYLPWSHTVPVLSQTERANLGHDVVFVGHGAPDQRIGCIQALLDGGLAIKLYGAEGGWKRALPGDLFRRFSPIRPLFGDEYCKVIAASRICLCFLSRANRDVYTIRVFEIPAIGGFLMCERTELMQSLYREDVEAVYFSSEEELVDKCRFYLSHDAARERIAQAGHDRCLSSGYDVFSRMKQWLADIEGWRQEA